MRLSGLVVAAILLVPAIILAQHSSGGSGGGGGASSGGFSGGSSSGGSSHGSSGSSGSSSGSSHSSSSGGSRSSASSAGSHNSSSSASHVASKTPASHFSPSSKLASTKENAAPEKRGFRSFFRHPFRPRVQTAEFTAPAPCRKKPCRVCPPGQSPNGAGACVLPVSNTCASGLYWNGFACGEQYRFNDDCRALAAQLAEQERRMQGQSDFGESLFYRMLRQQYEQCLERSRFRGYSSASLFATPY